MRIYAWLAIIAQLCSNSEPHTIADTNTHTITHTIADTITDTFADTIADTIADNRYCRYRPGATILATFAATCEPFSFFFT